jgi:hypothetical protein
MQEQKGLVFQTSDGSTYFIREELLEACKVRSDEELTVQQMVREEKAEGGPRASFGISFVQPVKYGDQAPSEISFQPNVVGRDELASRLGREIPETVMCCW